MAKHIPFLVTFVFGALLASTAAAADSFCLAGCPTGASANDVVITHHILELSNNPEKKFADWVAYKISAETICSAKRPPWKRDPDLDPDTTMSPTDYVGMRAALNSDRGHQAPYASICADAASRQEANYLSNITPQKSDLNEGAWEHLENAERNLIKNHVTDMVYSITGPLYEREMPKLPRAHLEHTVPSGYWKIVGINTPSGLETAAFIMDQETPRNADYCAQEVTVREVEQRAHLAFFPELNDTARALIEQGGMQGHLPQALGCEE